MAGKLLDVKDLRPGDVLLYRATDAWTNAIAKLIRMIDGEEVSHAGIYLGQGLVGEALIVGNSGVNRNPIAKSIDGCDWVAVRRIVHGRKLDLRPVIETANSMLDQHNRYAYEQILLLAVLLLTRKVELSNPILRRIITKTMDKANRWLSAMFGDGREPMICSEFVYRCYDQADDREDDPYSLVLGGNGPTAQARISRRRRRAQSPASAAQVPTIDPESLMARLANNPAKLAMQAAPAMAAPADESAAQPDPELIALVEEYEAEKKMPVLKAAHAPAAPSVDEVEAKAGEFAQLLTMAKAPMQAAAAGGAGDAPTEVVRTIADFVTPADLWRTSSLAMQGVLKPQ